jgi:hypothetical protein
MMEEESMNKARFPILAAFATLLLVSLACNFSVSTANISDAWLARDKEGKDRTTVFEPQDIFYAIVKLSNAPDDTTIKATWTAVDVAGTDPNTFLDETELTQGDGALAFNLSNDQLWPAGNYKVDLYLNGELDRTLDFEVGGGAVSDPAPTQEAPATSNPSISNAFTARDQEGADPTTVFAPEDVFYTIVDLVDAQDQATVKVVWTAAQAQGEAPDTNLHENELTTDSGQLYFQLSNNVLWPDGAYKVDIYLNDVLDRTLEFAVTSSGTSEPQASGFIQNAFTARDSDGNEPTTVFAPTDIFYAIVDVANAPADTTLEAYWYAVQAEGVDPNYLIDQASTTGGDDTYTFNLSNTQPWPAGDYKVEIYANGNLELTLGFTVQ